MSTPPTDPHDPASDPAPQESGPGESPAPAVHLLPIRRSVKYVPFLLTGAVVGFIVGGLVGRFGLTAPTADFVETTAYSAGSAVAYLGALGALVGALLGAIVALILDRRG